MSDPCTQRALIQRAVGGDGGALELLLLSCHEQLVHYVGARIPAELQRTLDPEDLVQEAHVDAFRSIRSFSDQGEGSWLAWLTTIAHRRLLDAIRSQGCQKRGGGKPVVEQDDTSMLGLLEMLSSSGTSPSRSAAGHEAVAAIRAALDELPADQRQAIQLVHIERVPVAEVAARMERSEGAVYMLCHRGMNLLRESLGRSSDFFTRKP